jgi:hypothetical protein
MIVLNWLLEKKMSLKLQRGLKCELTSILLIKQEKITEKVAPKEQ